MSVELSFLDKSGQVPEQSGLNWGFSNGHVCKDDAYIPLRVSTLKNNTTLFNPLSANNIINVIWDDGTKMTCLLEGKQSNPINGNIYAKQISSYTDKSLMGSYLRSRLKISSRKITLSDLQAYKRTSISVTKLTHDTYKFDFS